MDHWVWDIERRIEETLPEPSLLVWIQTFRIKLDQMRYEGSLYTSFVGNRPSSTPIHTHRAHSHPLSDRARRFSSPALSGPGPGSYDPYSRVEKYVRRPNIFGAVSSDAVCMSPTCVDVPCRVGRRESRSPRSHGRPTPWRLWRRACLLYGWTSTGTSTSPGWL
jgi:hypothetical protein